MTSPQIELASLEDRTEAQARSAMGSLDLYDLMSLKSFVGHINAYGQRRFTATEAAECGRLLRKLSAAIKVASTLSDEVDEERPQCVRSGHHKNDGRGSCCYCGTFL